MRYLFFIIVIAGLVTLGISCDSVPSDNGSDDTQRPTCVIKTPANNDIVWNKVTITAEATDNVGVSKVDFFGDYSMLFTDTSAPYTYTWDISGLSGDHYIYAMALDKAGNSGSSDTITVHIPALLIKDDFDTYAVGVVPSSPWDVVTSANGTIVISDKFAASMGNTADINSDGSSLSTVQADLPFSNATKMMFLLSFYYEESDLKIRFGNSGRDWTSTGPCLLIENNVMYIDDGSIVPTKAMDLTPKKWYSLRLDIDCSTQTFNIQIDGKVVKNGASFMDNVGQINRLGFFTLSNDIATKEVHIDSLYAYDMGGFQGRHKTSGRNSSSKKTLILLNR
jgi:hypothetical protein